MGLLSVRQTASAVRAPAVGLQLRTSLWTRSLTGAVHSRQRGVWRERVLGRVEPQSGGLHPLVEGSQLLTALADTSPDGTGVLQARKRAETDELCPEGCDRCRRWPHRRRRSGPAVGTRGCHRGSQRDMCLFGFGESQAARAGERLLYRGDPIGQFGHVDSDEQPHSSPRGRRS